MRPPSRQNGATLVVALIFLVLLALLALSAYQTSLTDQHIAGNMQLRAEALNAAQEAIETVISNDRFTTEPSSAIANPCGEANTYCTDFDKDGVAEYTTRLVPPPACVATQATNTADLDLTNADDLSCAVGQTQQFGIEGSAASAMDSLCSNTIWDITAETRARGNTAKVTVSQGIRVRVSAEDTVAACM